MKKFFKFGCLGIIALIVLGGVIGALSGGEEPEQVETTAKAPTKEQANEKETVAPKEATAEAPKEATAEAPKEAAKEEPKEESVPREYSAALKKAETYAKTMYMSKAGIYDQLTSEYGENFPAEAAQYAIDNIVFDWKANALEKAKSYAETMSMSDSAIYEQLVSEYGEKFTPEEAQYAVDNLK